ncbi:hypothetical protein AGMMS49938_07340 [Fibrobacterales bacterium]|nr:hypothetical protein AGMMS49938_07340 [Fibrobacterales bacterium]
MKASFKTFSMLFFVLFAVSAWAGKYIIDSFDDSTDPGEPDNYISGEFNNELKPVKPDQVKAQSGLFYVRQKFEDPFNAEEPLYQMFQGRPTEKVADLGKISILGVPTKTLVRLKFFYNRNTDGTDDLETIYFDGKDVFVEGGDPIYAELSGRIEELIPEIKKEYKISIVSQPTGANINIGGVDKGVAPLDFTVPAPNVIGTVLSLEGHYTVIKPIKPQDGRTTQEVVNMVARQPLDNPGVTFRTALETAKANKDAAAINKIAVDAKKKLGTFNDDFKKNVDAIMAKFPVNPPKVSGESDTDFSKRQTLWANEQTKERNLLAMNGKSYFDDLKALVDEAENAAAELDFVLRYEYVPNVALTFPNMGVKDFLLNAEYSNSRIDFSYSKARIGYDGISRAQFSSDQSRVHGVLKIWDTPNDNGKYASIYDIAFFYDETPLKILQKGSFSISEATAQSKNTEKDLNARIAKYKGKAAWDSRDTDATLAALRAGEVKDAPKVVAAAPDEEEAEYSEEDDEEEFEEESEEQERADYSKYGAVGNATDIFGNTDEYLFWTGVAFAAVAVGSGVMGVLQMMKKNEANDAVKSVDSKIEEVKNGIAAACMANANSDDCESAALIYANRGDYEDAPLYHLYRFKSSNEKTRDSYKMPMIAWYSGAGLSLVASITLFAW